MASSQQKVRVVNIEDKTIQLDITEIGDIKAIHILLTGDNKAAGSDPLAGTVIPDSIKKEAFIFAGQMLCEYGEDTAFFKAVEKFEEEDRMVMDEPEAFFDDVRVLSIKPLSKDNCEGTWLYNALVEFDVKNTKWLKDFETGKEFYTKSYPFGDWDIAEMF